MKDGFTPYKSKFHKDFKGDKIPFGAELEYRPSAPRDRERLHKYGNKTLSGVVIGYDQKARGDWSGDYLVVDWEELEQAEHAREVHIKRVKEVNKLTLNGKFRFPLAEGILSQPAPGATKLRKLTQRLSWVQEDAPVDDDQISEEAGIVSEQSLDEREKPAPGAPPAGGNSKPDEWRITRDLLIVTHNQPRTQFFQPTDENSLNRIEDFFW
jgi:hypothetical protein